MTLGLALTLLLSQATAPAEPLPLLPEPPPEARETPPPPAPGGPSVMTRSLLAGGGGTLAGGASLGIALLLVGSNPLFDPTFATAALASLMISGVAFSIHAALGGRGEITLGFLLATVVMASTAAIVSAATQGDRVLTPILVAAIGSLPAAAVATFGLEGTSPRPKAQVAVSVAPTGIFGRF